MRWENDETLKDIKLSVKKYIFRMLQSFDNILVRIIDIRDLIIAKKSANRFKDKDDIEHLDC